MVFIGRYKPVKVHKGGKRTRGYFTLSVPVQFCHMNDVGPGHYLYAYVTTNGRLVYSVRSERGKVPPIKRYKILRSRQVSVPPPFVEQFKIDGRKLMSAYIDHSGDLIFTKE